jgi:hypothetical protein
MKFSYSFLHYTNTCLPLVYSLRAELAAGLCAAPRHQAWPNNLPAAVPGAAHAQDSAAAPAGSLAAALASAGVLTDAQQAILQDAWDQQLAAAEEPASESDSDSDSGSDVGVAVSAGADEGTAVSAADRGATVCADSAQATEPTSKSLADQYKEKLKQPLWECNGQKCTLLLCQVIFMLMAWKLDYCVRDAAFASLLGMLSEVLLPQVSCTARACAHRSQYAYHTV